MGMGVGEGLSLCGLLGLWFVETFRWKWEKGCQNTVQTSREKSELQVQIWGSVGQRCKLKLRS